MSIKVLPLCYANYISPLPTHLGILGTSIALLNSILVIFHFETPNFTNFGPFWSLKIHKIPQMSVKVCPMCYATYTSTLATHLGRLGTPITLFSSILVIFHFWLPDFINFGPLLAIKRSHDPTNVLTTKWAHNPINVY